MTPRSRKKRFLYFLFFFLLFLVAAPFILFYSIGYNITSNLGVFRTGGIYVYAPQTGVKVYLDEKLDDTTSIFQYGILMKGLRAKNYTIRVSKDGYVDWNKLIQVKEERVSEAYPFLIPTHPATTSVPSQISKTAATTSPLIANTEYTNLLALFQPKKITQATSTSASLIKATSTNPSIENKKLIVEKIGNSLKASWQGNVEDTPFYFCSNETNCKKEFVFYSADSIGVFDFYPSRNDVVIFTSGSKLFVTELDMRTPQNTTEIYNSSTGGKIDFKIIDNETLVIKEGKQLTKLSLVYAK